MNEGENAIRANQPEISRGKQPVFPPHYPNVKLCIRSQTGDEDYYRVARDKKMKNVLLDYCKVKNLAFGSVAFVCNDQILKSGKTPDELGLDNEDVMEALSYQDGGWLLQHPYLRKPFEG